MNETEKLLVCAKAVGHYIVPDYKAPDKPAVTVDGDIWIDTCSDKLRPQLYNPLTNDAQAFELMVKFRMIVDGQASKKIWLAIFSIDGETVYDAIGATPNEAIVNAVVAMEEGK